MIDRANKNWNKSITDEEIFNREFSIGYLLQSNPERFAELSEHIFATYRVLGEFTYLGHNGKEITANGQRLVWRENKFSDFSIGKDVSVIRHNLSRSGGGSHNHPTISFEGAVIVLSFTSYGLPFIDKLNGWNLRIVSLEKI